MRFAWVLIWSFITFKEFPCVCCKKPGFPGHWVHWLVPRMYVVPAKPTALPRFSSPTWIWRHVAKERGTRIRAGKVWQGSWGAKKMSQSRRKPSFVTKLITYPPVKMPEKEKGIVTIIVIGHFFKICGQKACFPLAMRFVDKEPTWWFDNYLTVCF